MLNVHEEKMTEIKDVQQRILRHLRVVIEDDTLKYVSAKTSLRLMKYLKEFLGDVFVLERIFGKYF